MRINIAQFMSQELFKIYKTTYSGYLLTCYIVFFLFPELDSKTSDWKNIYTDPLADNDLHFLFLDSSHRSE